MSVSVGDVCIYRHIVRNNVAFSIVRVIEILGGVVAKVKILSLIDDSDNGYFNYLLKSDRTMFVCIEYLFPLGPKLNDVC